MSPLLRLSAWRCRRGTSRIRLQAAMSQQLIALRTGCRRLTDTPARRLNARKPMALGNILQRLACFGRDSEVLAFPRDKAQLQLGAVRSRRRRFVRGHLRRCAGVCRHVCGCAGRWRRLYTSARGQRRRLHSSTTPFVALVMRLLVAETQPSAPATPVYQALAPILHVVKACGRGESRPQEQRGVEPAQVAVPVAVRLDDGVGCPLCSTSQHRYGARHQRSSAQSLTL